MKLAGHYVRLRHKPARIICDALSLGIVLFTFMSAHLMMERYPQLKSPLFRADCVKLWIFPVLAVTALAAYTVFIFTNHKFNRYKITEENAQSVFDWCAFAASLCKLPVLVAIADVMITFQRWLIGNEVSWFSIGYIFYVLILVIIIRFSMHRIRRLTEPPKTVTDNSENVKVKVRVADDPSDTIDNTDNTDDTKKGN